MKEGEVFIELDWGRCRSCEHFMCEPPNDSSKYVIECAIGQNLFVFVCDEWKRASPLAKLPRFKSVIEER